MKNNLKHLPAFLILMFVALGCATMQTIESKQVPQDEIVQTYSVIADKSGMQIYAVFNYGNWGKSVDLDLPSKIEYNGAEMPQTSSGILSGTSYHVSLNAFQANHKFVYTNENGKVFQNEMQFAPVDINASEIAVNRAGDTVVPLSRVVGEDEDVTINLNTLEKRPEAANTNGVPTPAKPNAPDYDLELHGELDASRSAVVLKSKNFKKFVIGKAVLKITVGRKYQLRQAAKAGGSMYWRYVSQADANVVN